MVAIVSSYRLLLDDPLLLQIMQEREKSGSHSLSRSRKISHIALACNLDWQRIPLRWPIPHNEFRCPCMHFRTYHRIDYTNFYKKASCILRLCCIPHRLTTFRIWSRGTHQCFPEDRSILGFCLGSHKGHKRLCNLGA